MQSVVDTKQELEHDDIERAHSGKGEMEEERIELSEEDVRRSSSSRYSQADNARTGELGERPINGSWRYSAGSTSSRFSIKSYSVSEMFSVYRRI